MGWTMSAAHFDKGEHMKAVLTFENEAEFNAFMAGRTTQPPAVEDKDTEEPQFTQEEAERYKVASDLATVCDYLEDSEIIKIRLIISKCEARKENAESK